MWYIQRNRTPVPVDASVWAPWFEHASQNRHRKLADTALRGSGREFHISTVFIGLDYEIYETMVFDRDGNDVDCRRATTYMGALANHAALTRKRHAELLSW